MDRDYDVGYRKPPPHARFTKGRSGNPRGRPKGSKNLKVLLAEELQKPITLKEGGVRKRVSKAQALAMGLVDRSLRGDPRATTTVFSIANLAEAEVPIEAVKEYALEDEALIERAVARRLATHPKSGGDRGGGG